MTSDLPTCARFFFNTHVLPSLDAWAARPTDIRLAMIAVVSLNQMADHFWHAYASNSNLVLGTRSVGKFRAELVRLHPSFAVVRDVAEAHKHVELSRDPRLLTTCNQTDYGTTGYGESAYGCGPFGGGPSVVVTLDDNSKHHLCYLVGQVKDIWIAMLDESRSV